MPKGFPKKLPSRVLVQVKKTPEGTFYAKFPELPGCFTEADGPFDLIFQVNDAIFTYFDVPRKKLKKDEVKYWPPEDYFKRLLRLKETRPSKPSRRPRYQAQGEFGLYYAAA